MTTFIESRVIAFASSGWVEREKEHSPCRAEVLFYSRRVPSFAESFGREDDEASAGFGDCVAAFFFAGAHEGSDSRASWPNTFCGGDKRSPFARVRDKFARTLERRYYRKVEKRRVAVGEPFAPAELDGRYATKEALVFLAEMGANRIFFYIAPECGELSAFFDDPVVPRFFKDVRRGGAGAPLSRTWWVLRIAASAAQFPVCSSKRFRKLAHQYAERHRLFNFLDFYQEVDMVGHNDERRDFVEASPFKVKVSDDGIEGLSGFVLNKALWSYFRKCFYTLERFQGDHIKVRRFIIKTKKPSHKHIISQ